MRSLILTTVLSALVITACHAVPRGDSVEADAGSSGKATYEVWGQSYDADQVRMYFMRGTDRALVYGDGTLIWKGESQHTVDRKVVRALLNQYVEAGFREMKAFYGDGPRRIIAQVNIQLGDYWHESTRNFAPEGEDPVRPLIADLMDVIRPIGEGHSVSSFTDGLEKLANGELSPKTLQFVVQHQPDDAEGWQLTVKHGEAEWRSLSADGKLGEPVDLDVNDEWFGDFASMLHQVEYASLPQNVIMKGHRTQLSAQILDKRHVAVARDFRREPTAADDSARPRIKRLLERLQALHEASKG